MTDDLVELDRKIAEALTALRGARALTTRSPTCETQWREALAERALNHLLDRRPACQMRQQAQSLTG